MYDLCGKSEIQRLNFKHKQAKTDSNKNTSENRALLTKLRQKYNKNEEKMGIRGKKWTEKKTNNHQLKTKKNERPRQRGNKQTRTLGWRMDIND